MVTSGMDGVIRVEVFTTHGGYSDDHRLRRGQPLCRCPSQ